MTSLSSRFVFFVECANMSTLTDYCFYQIKFQMDRVFYVALSNAAVPRG